jgi:hypothetical protein
MCWLIFIIFHIATVNCYTGGFVNTFLCARISSLYSYSCWFWLGLLGVLFLFTAKIIPINIQLEKSYFLQYYKTHMFRNAYIFTSKLAYSFAIGLNVIHLIHLTTCKIKYHDIECASAAIGIVLGGSIKGHSNTRSVHTKMDALYVGSFNNRILDVGYISSRCYLGILGVKVATIL